MEIVSPSNSHAEMLAKVRLFLEAGAEEVWLVNEGNGLEIQGTNGLLTKLVLVPGVAAKIRELI